MKTRILLSLLVFILQLPLAIGQFLQDMNQEQCVVKPPYNEEYYCSHLWHSGVSYSPFPFLEKEENRIAIPFKEETCREEDSLYQEYVKVLKPQDKFEGKFKSKNGEKDVCKYENC